MVTMNISLPDSMRTWVEAQLATGLYANNSDYIRDLIRKDQQRAEKLAILQQAVTAGLDRGDAGALDMQAVKQQARGKASNRTSNPSSNSSSKRAALGLQWRAVTLRANEGNKAV